jgi:hypothetical protein
MSTRSQRRRHQPGRRRADAIEALGRRQAHLTERLESFRGDPSRTRAELDAVNYALAVIRAAIKIGVLDEIELIVGVRREGNAIRGVE